MERDTAITTEAPFDITELDLNGLDCRGLGRMRLALQENYRGFYFIAGTTETLIGMGLLL